MPARQPFTYLCQQLARPRHAGRADLHLHTTYSDGSYTTAQVVELARRSGLSAVAITDHDTLDGVEPARQAAGEGLEVIAGVEITTEYRGRELHLLAYFVRTGESPLRSALDGMRAEREARFWAMVDRLAALGVSLPEKAFAGVAVHGTLGRRNLAEVLVREGKAATVRDAFHRYLGDGRRAEVPKRRLPVRDAIALVREAGGVAAWAHPVSECSHQTLAELKGWGLGAVEAQFPSCRPARGGELRLWAKQLDLAITGGSDCHGPDQAGRAVGTCSITYDELTRLRAAVPS